MTQLDIFAKYQRHSPTSHAAALEIEPRAGTLRFKVLEFIRSCGAFGATDEEIQVALGMNPSTERPRRVELGEAGLLRDSGRERLTCSRRRAVVWVAAKTEEPTQ